MSWFEAKHNFLEILSHVKSRRVNKLTFFLKIQIWTSQSLLKRPLRLCVLLTGRLKQHSSVPQDRPLPDQRKMHLLQDDKQMRNGSLWMCVGLSCDANCHTCIIQRQVNKRGKKSKTCFGSLPTVSLASLCLGKTNTHQAHWNTARSHVDVLHSVAQTAPPVKQQKSRTYLTQDSPQRPTFQAPGASDLLCMEGQCIQTYWVPHLTRTHLSLLMKARRSVWKVDSGVLALNCARATRGCLTAPVESDRLALSKTCKH